MKELTFKPFKLKAATGDFSMTFRVFQGTQRISVSDGNKLALDRSIPEDRLYMIKRNLIKAVDELKPGERYPLMFSNYNFETKKSSLDWVFTILKDDKQCFSIGISWDEGKHLFPIKGPFNVAEGDSPMSEVERSKIGLLSLIEYFNQEAPIHRALSNSKEYWTNLRQNRGGGRQQQSSSSSPAAEDYF